MSSLNIDIADFMEEVKIKLENLCCWVDLLRCSNYNALVLSPGEKLNQALLQTHYALWSMSAALKKRIISTFYDFIFFIGVSQFI